MKVEKITKNSEDTNFTIVVEENYRQEQKTLSRSSNLNNSQLFLKVWQKI